MGVKRRQNWQGQQRVDIPHLKSVESAVSNDFDELIAGLIIGENQSYIVRGFEINMPGSIGSSANGLQLIVEDSSFLHGASDESGTFYTIPDGTPAEILSSTTNERVEGAFTPNTDNYVGIEFIRKIDDDTIDQVYFWNPTTNIEITKTVPLAIILDYKIVISTSSFAANVLPITVVKTDASNSVISIEDRRPLLLRLGTAGDSTPDPFYSYPWDDGRSETYYTSTSPTSSPFQGGDKQIKTMKELFDALMTEIKLTKGTPYWYSESTGSVLRLRQDVANTAFTGKGSVSHAITMFNGQVTGMTTDVVITAANDNVVLTADGVKDIDTLISEWNSDEDNAGNQLELSSGIGSQVPTANITIESVPGQMNWNSDIFLNFIGGRLRYKISQNDYGSDVTLTDNQVAYLNLVRGVDIIPKLEFTNGSSIVTSVGNVGWTFDLEAGDYVKDASEGDEKYYEIASVDNLVQVTLTEPFLELTSSASGTKAQYAFGSYETNPSPSNERHIQIADRGSVPFSEDYFWLFFRQDDTGSLPKVYSRIGNQELELGESQSINDNTSDDILLYIGSASESDNSPNYIFLADDAKTDTENYNTVNGENLTRRASKLTAMMADKAQDKTIILAPLVDYITNINSAGSGPLHINNESGSPLSGVAHDNDGAVHTESSFIFDVPSDATNMDGSLTFKYSLDAPVSGVMGVFLQPATGSFLSEEYDTNNFQQIGSIDLSTLIDTAGVEGSTFETFPASGDFVQPGSNNITLNNSISQSWVATSSEEISKIRVGMKGIDNTSTFQMQMTIHADAAGVPGAVLYTSSSTVASSSLGTFGFNTVDFPFSAGTALNIGTTYHVSVIAISGVANTDTINVLVSHQITNSNPYPSGSFLRSLDGGANWNPVFGLEDEDWYMSVFSLSATEQTAAVTITGSDFSDVGVSNVDLRGLRGALVFKTPVGAGVTAASKFKILDKDLTSNPNSYAQTYGQYDDILSTSGSITKSGTKAYEVDFSINKAASSTQDIEFVHDSGNPVLNVMMHSSLSNGLIGLLGTLALEENQAAYFEVNRNTAFNIADLSGLTIASISDVPLKENVFVFAVRGTGTSVYLWDGTELIEGKNLTSGVVSEILNSNAYDEPLDVVAGAPSGSNEITGPVLENTIITLPNDSRDGNNPQGYVVGQGVLEVKLNGQELVLGDGFNEVGAIGSVSTLFEILIDLEEEDRLQLRIDTAGGYFGIGSPGGGEANQGSNVGGEAELFKNKVGTVLNFKTVKAGTNITISEEVDTITINASSTGNLTVTSRNATSALTLNENVVLTDASLGDVTLTLPPAASASGKVYNIKKTDSSVNFVIIDADALEQIDGSNSIQTNTQYESFTLVCNGGSWFII